MICVLLTNNSVAGLHEFACAEKQNCTVTPPSEAGDGFVVEPTETPVPKPAPKILTIELLATLGVKLAELITLVIDGDCATRNGAKKLKSQTRKD